MDAESWLNRIRDDEGITDGLGDDEARVLLDWLCDRVRRRVQSSNDRAAVARDVQEEIRLGRFLGQTIARLCEDRDLASAQQLWAKEKRRPNLAELDAGDPTGALKKLIAWQEATHD